MSSLRARLHAMVLRSSVPGSLTGLARPSTAERHDRGLWSYRARARLRVAHSDDGEPEARCRNRVVQRPQRRQHAQLHVALEQREQRIGDHTDRRLVSQPRAIRSTRRSNLRAQMRRTRTRRRTAAPIARSAATPARWRPPSLRQRPKRTRADRPRSSSRRRSRSHADSRAAAGSCAAATRRSPRRGRGPLCPGVGRSA